MNFKQGIRRRLYASVLICCLMSGTFLPLNPNNMAHAASNVELDFVVPLESRAARPQSYADLEIHGWRLDLSPETGTTPIIAAVESRLTFMSYGLRSLMPANGDQVVFQVKIPEAGSYRLDVTGGQYGPGAEAAIYVNDTYMGIYNFIGSGVPVGETTRLNSIYLSEGTHRVAYRMINATRADRCFYIRHNTFVSLSALPEIEQVNAQSTKTSLFAGERASINFNVKMAGDSPIVSRVILACLRKWEIGSHLL